GIFKAAMGLRGRKTQGEPVPHSQAGAGRDAGLARDVEGAGWTRIQIRRADDRLCVHAGDRDGQRPSGRLLSPRASGGKEEMSAGTLVCAKRFSTSSRSKESSASLF